MMLELQDNFGAFVDEDDEDGGLFTLPGDMPQREMFHVGHERFFPDWFMDAMTKQHIITRTGENHWKQPIVAADVLVRGRYIRAHKDDYIIRIGNTFTIESPRQNQ